MVTVELVVLLRGPKWDPALSHRQLVFSSDGDTATHVGRKRDPQAVATSELHHAGDFFSVVVCTRRESVVADIAVGVAKDARAFASLSSVQSKKVGFVEGTAGLRTTLNISRSGCAFAYRFQRKRHEAMVPKPAESYKSGVRIRFELVERTSDVVHPVSYTHLTLPTIYSV